MKIELYKSYVMELIRNIKNKWKTIDISWLVQTKVEMFSVQSCV